MSMSAQIFIIVAYDNVDVSDTCTHAVYMYM